MSIQSNINNTIGQVAMLATLNPAIQEMGETAKDKSKIKSVEKQLDTLKEKSNKEVFIPESAKLGPRFPLERDAAQYNKLVEAHNELAGKLAGKGEKIDAIYPQGTSSLADLHRRAEQTTRIRKQAQREKEQIEREKQRAEEQRYKVEAMQELKKMEEEAQKAFRSKQIRDLIMNPNLEVNNGTGNDTRR